MLQMQGIW